MEGSIEKAEEFKTKGNEYFKQNKFSDAVDSYTEAINLVPEHKKAAIYYANRAFAQIKQENTGFALEDAKKSQERDPTYTKAYYRQGQCYMMLQKINEAQTAFKQARKLTGGKDQDILDKLAQIKKMKIAAAFAEAIEGQEDDTKKIEKCVVSEIDVPSSYDGPKLNDDASDITEQWCQQYMDYMKEEKKLHKKYVIILLKKIKAQFKTLKNLVEVPMQDEEQITVCGDTHGQYYDLLNIFKINGVPSEKNPYIFNGDFVDRGSFSIEVIMALFAWKVCLPNHIHMSRGNHESRNMNKLYGFEGECGKKYDSQVFEFFADIFCHLPLGMILNKKVMINHGGLFAKDGVTIADIQKVNRFREPPEEGIMSDMLWSDPVDMNGRHPSKRGISIGFGPDITAKFLKENNLELMIRSHEMRPEGYDVVHDGKLITIFSAPNYCDQMGNKGAFIRFTGKDMKPRYEKFSAVDHPKIPPMAYARQFFNMF